MIKFIFFVSSLAVAAPHLELELSSRDYNNLLKSQARWSESDAPLDPVIKAGKRMLDWVTYVNDHRTPETKISLSSPETQPAYPIDSPRISNPTLIIEEFEGYKAIAPEWLKAVVFNGQPLTENLTVPDEEYKTWGIKLDRIYQRAARWILQEPYLAQYAEREHLDVRGYYHLTNTQNLKAKLDAWDSLSTEDKKNFSNWMVGQCFNKSTATKAACQRDLDTAIQKMGVYSYHTNYKGYGERLWNGFFEIPVTRDDVLWKTDTLTLSTFLDPGKPEIRDFLRTNIEDEWKFNGWQLQLDFVGSGAHPKIVFQPGATPHVNGLAGDTITMDANAPLTEYDVRWTIRHEFGHVLGFPDCYVEFYDQVNKIMVSYQIDITNLMCSRRGHLKQTHYDEMEKAYKNVVLIAG